MDPYLDGTLDVAVSPCHCPTGTSWVGRRSDLQGTGSSNSGEKGRGLGELGWVEQVTQAEELHPPPRLAGYDAQAPPPNNFLGIVRAHSQLAVIALARVTRSTLYSLAPL